MGLQELDLSRSETQRHSAALIRDALAELCFDRGFAAVTVADLCRRSGLSPAEFRSLYGSLEECFFDVCAGEVRRYRKAASEASAGLTDWRSRLRATAYALYRSLGEDNRLRRLTIVEARGVDEATARLLDEAIEPICDLIDEGRAEPSAPTGLTRATAEFLAGAIFSEIYLSSLHRGPLPPEREMVPKMMYLTVLPYLGAPDATLELRTPPPRR